MNEDDAASLTDIRNAAREALEFVRGVRFHEFIANRGLVLIIQREIEIMGEPSKRVSDDFRMTHPEVPFRMMAGMRDVIVHDYADVKNERIWLVVSEHLEPLVQQLTELLRTSGFEES